MLASPASLLAKSAEDFRWRSLRDLNPGDFAPFAGCCRHYVSDPDKSFDFPMWWARKDKNHRWSRERYQAVAQRPERVHFDLVHIAPFDPAVPCRTARVCRPYRSRETPRGEELSSDDAGTMHRRSDGANLPNNRPHLWAARDHEERVVVAGLHPTCPFAGTELYGTRKLSAPGHASSLHLDTQALCPKTPDGSYRPAVQRTSQLLAPCACRSRFIPPEKSP